MRFLPGVVVVLAAAPAIAQPAAPAAMEPAPPPPAAPVPTTYYEPHQPYLFPSPEPTAPRRSWFGVVGMGGVGYVGREGPTSAVNDPDSGNGVALEALAGKWISDDFAVGARMEAHTDDAEFYTNSSFTILTRFPLGESRRFYLEPALGLAFFKTESTQETDTGLAMAITGGYPLTRGRFALDLRFGMAHHRVDASNNGGSYSHGTIWAGAAIGLQ